MCVFKSPLYFKKIFMLQLNLFCLRELEFIYLYTNKMYKEKTINAFLNRKTYGIY